MNYQLGSLTALRFLLIILRSGVGSAPDRTPWAYRRTVDGRMAAFKPIIGIV